MGEVAAESLCARAAHVDKFKTLSLPISNIANGPNHFFCFEMFQFEVPPPQKFGYYLT